MVKLLFSDDVRSDLMVRLIDSAAIQSFFEWYSTCFLLFFIVFFCFFCYSHESSLSWWFMIPSPSTVGCITGNAIRHVQILSRPNQWVKGPMVSNLHIDLAHSLSKHDPENISFAWPSQEALLCRKGNRRPEDVLESFRCWVGCSCHGHVPLHRGAGHAEWWRRYGGVPWTRYSHTGWEMLGANSHVKLDVSIPMIPSCCHSNCFLVSFAPGNWGRS